jgi:hypothetical protein
MSAVGEIGRSEAEADWVEIDPIGRAPGQAGKG